MKVVNTKTQGKMGGTYNQRQLKQNTVVKLKHRLEVLVHLDMEGVNTNIIWKNGSDIMENVRD